MKLLWLNNAITARQSRDLTNHLWLAGRSDLLYFVDKPIKVDRATEIVWETPGISGDVKRSDYLAGDQSAWVLKVSYE